GEYRGIAHHFFVAHGYPFHPGERVLPAHFFRDRELFRFFGGLPRESNQFGHDFSKPPTVIHLYVIQGAEWHFRKRRFVGILHYTDAAPRLDGHQTGGTVVVGAGQQHPHHSGPIGLSSRPEQGVDSRPVAVLFGSADHAHSIPFHQKMAIWR